MVLQARFPSIRGFVKTDCKEDIGIDELQTVIAEAVNGMDVIRMSFPAHWFAVKERLESMERDFMVYDDFRELCKDEAITEESDQDDLSWILHCLGIVLNYRKDTRLRETSVLKPEWVTEGIYKILNADELMQRQGELKLRDLENLLPKKTVPSQ